MYIGMKIDYFQTGAKEFVIMNIHSHALEALALPTLLLQILTVATIVGSWY